MKISVYYVVRLYKNGTSRIDSGPHHSIVEAMGARDEDHRWNAEDFQIFESSIEGEVI